MSLTDDLARSEALVATTTGPGPIRRRLTPLRFAIQNHWRSLIGIVTLAVIWEVSVRLELVNPSAVPTLGATLADLVNLVSLPGFWVTLGYTLRSAFVGLALAILIALPLGVAIASSQWLQRITSATIDAVRPVPPIVLLPVALLIIGGGLGFKTVLVLQGALWALLLQTAYGVRSMDPVVTDVTNSFRIDPVRKLFLVRLPAAAPVIFSGIRLAASTAFGVSVMSELVGGERGLGQILAVAQSANNIDRVYSITIVTGLVGLAIAWGFGKLQQRIVVWGGDAR